MDQALSAFAQFCSTFGIKPAVAPATALGRVPSEHPAP